MQRKQILKEITQLNSLKAGQNTDIPNKIIKQNLDIFADFSFQVSKTYVAIALKTRMWV